MPRTQTQEVLMRLSLPCRCASLRVPLRTSVIGASGLLVTTLIILAPAAPSSAERGSRPGWPDAVKAAADDRGASISPAGAPGAALGAVPRLIRIKDRQTPRPLVLDQ